ncbi:MULTISPECIES: GNAT family N-acetyltransferase [Enterococcus]|jgi:RimJ/RimL family protein N-acetyltransferase|uniref:GNAT family N-acetyltransferase n=1 Tax=Enterococcus TaxID=1350 RepID=UPI0019F2D09F|nr:MULTISPECIES: GNAT family protein [Enterococcus]EGP4714975.1 GNAT family N-acetyltransferase [Enterococcus faecium]EGP5222357.1 N-acetyltransferase [Enterococcus faecium]EGP5497363.1 N-acetyltransferase [Enterococcus faecium]EKY8186013.1 GNAT family N-acetyltransferase [Enterococcus faecium]EME3557711.1 GNAT family N-acetyltransferase [Enterococcus faecium]
MSEEIGIILREAVPDDAKDILSMMEQVNSETEFLALDEAELLLPPETLSEELSYMYESNNNLLLLAINEGTIVGTASVKADSQFRLSHVGEVGISILQEYWGMGLGTLMLEEIINWAKEMGVLFRLELDVQVRNERAVHLYQKMGFQIEAVMPRGTRTDLGEFLDVYKMSYLIE